MRLPQLLILGVLVLTVVGLIVTNPGPADYALYAAQQADRYLSDQVCDEMPAELGSGFLQEQCMGMIAELMPQLDDVLRDRTERLNLGIASIYRTSFGISGLPLLPEYRTETLGIVQRFFTYRVVRAN
jgi:hypothetical protein